MAEKDHTQHFVGLVGDAPNTVSRVLSPGERAFLSVILESGKPVLDGDVNLHGALPVHLERQYRRQALPSGWFQSSRSALDDFILGLVPAQFDPIGAVNGEFPAAAIAADGTLINAIMLPRLEANVAGMPVVVEYTNTSAKGYNLVELEAPTIYDGTGATVKRTDFLFLEVWLAPIAPSPRASGILQVVDAATLLDAPGTTITIGGVVLTADAAPGVDIFVPDLASKPNTALAIAAAINDVANSFATFVLAVASGEQVLIKSLERGVGIPVPQSGNFITLATAPSVPGALVVSGATLTGGADRGFKPGASSIYRHGNVQSPESVWLDDDLTDPAIDVESSQRVQIQYRIRATGASEAVNFKKYPDGFSTALAGPAPGLFAQGGEAAPVSAAGGSRAYPFVPANGSTVWEQSSALAYDHEDNGLWIAGDGSAQSAQDLLSLDGFVYAIPLCFVFRHNNVSDVLAGFKGFDPVNNTNGAPTYDHGGYTGPLGAIAAGASDRPDGAYVDVIRQTNLLDLRRHVSPTGFDLAREVEYQMQSLLDGTTRTWAVDTASKQTLGGSSGDVSTQYLICNEIGRGPGHEGNPPFSGDTQMGVFVRNFDHFARRYGDQPVVERVVIAFYPGDRPDAVSQGDPAGFSFGTENPGKYVVKTEILGTPVSDENWFEGDVLHLDLSELNASVLGGFFQGLDGGGNSAVGHADPHFGNFAPSLTRITDVLSLYHDDGHYNLVGAGSTAVPQTVQASRIQGLGTDHLTIELDANDTPVTGGVAASILSIVITAPGAGYSPGDPITIGSPDLGGGVQATAEVATVDGGGGVLTITITDPGSGYTTIPTVTFTVGAGATGTAAIQQYRMVGGLDGGGVPVEDGSPRRIFVEVEITYPVGVGLTDTPDLEITPDAVIYDGTGAGPGPLIETAIAQRPHDLDAVLAPRFRSGFREVALEYVANDTVSHAGGQERPGAAVGSVDQETLVSRSDSALVFPRRIYGASAGAYAATLSVQDLTDPVSVIRVVDETTTEFGSSSRLVNLDTGGAGQAIPLTGDGHSLCAVEYFAQDPVPNYGVSGAGYQVGIYYRSNAPQTAGSKEGDITSTGDGTLPTTLQVEPLLMSYNLWTGQRGVGSQELAFPYGTPLDQIPINDGTVLDPGNLNQIAGVTEEWYFSGTVDTAIADFDAGTGLLALHPFVQGDVQNTLTFGGADNDEKPRKDAEFRAYYPFADDQTYRPTIISQPLSGAVRHKVFTPFLARAVADVSGVEGGLLWRKGELLLIVLSRFAELDNENSIRFLDPVTASRACAAVYRTRNMLLLSKRG